VATSEKNQTINEIPKLRFLEFFGDWSQKKMSDISKVNQGLQIAISDRFISPTDNSFFYLTNEFLKKGSKKEYYIQDPPSSVICNADDILMTRTGNTGQVVTGVYGAFHNNFFIIRYDREKILRWFLYYFLIRTKTQQILLSLAGTSTIPDLNHSDFYKVKINLPSIKEQKKIAAFLSSVDNKLNKLRDKHKLLETYKRGLMQKIFSQKLRLKP